MDSLDYTQMDELSDCYREIDRIRAELEKVTKERDELDRKRAQLELENYDNIKLVALREEELAQVKAELKEWMDNADMLSRKSNGFEDAYAIERRALELACEYIPSVAQEPLKETLLHHPDYFRKQAEKEKK